jgi:hypothetical protein
LGVLLGIYALISRSHPRQQEFTVGERVFTAPPSAIMAGSQAIVCMFFAGGVVVTERVPNGDSMRLAEFGSAWIVSLIVVSIFVAIAVAMLVVQRPQLSLDPEGLTIRRLRRSARLAWEELAPGGPLPPKKKRQAFLQLYRKPPPNYPNYVPTEAVPIGWLNIDPTYVAAAIRHYAEHPEDRAAVGTAAELNRLKSAGQIPAVAT